MFRKADADLAFTKPDYKTSEKSSKNLWFMGFCADYLVCFNEGFIH